MSSSLLSSIIRRPSLPPSFSSLSRAAIFDFCIVVVCHPSYRLHCHRHVVRCHRCLLLLPPLLLAGSHCPLPDAGWFLFVRCSHCRRSVVGKQTNNRPYPQVPSRLWVDVGRRGARAKVSHALFDCCHHGCPSSIVSIVSIHRESFTVHRRVVSPSATSPPQHYCHLRLKRLIVVYID